MIIYRVVMIDHPDDEEETTNVKTFSSATLAQRYLCDLVDEFRAEMGSDRLADGEETGGSTSYHWNKNDAYDFYSVWIERDELDQRKSKVTTTNEKAICMDMDAEKANGTEGGINPPPSSSRSSWPHKPSVGEMLNVLQYLDEELMVEGSFQEVCDYVRKLADQ